MKIKHIIILQSLICGGLILFGCASNGELTRLITAWQAEHPNRGGDCVIDALKNCAMYERRGVPYRMAHGYFKGDPHAWCEYYDELTDSWLVHDDSIWYIGKIGCPIEAIKSGDKQDYERTWTGVPKLKG